MSHQVVLYFIVLFGLFFCVKNSSSGVESGGDVAAVGKEGTEVVEGAVEDEEEKWRRELVEKIRNRPKVFIIDSVFSTHEYVKEALLSRGWEEAKPRSIRWDFKWSWSWDRLKPKSDHQWVNHFEGSHDFGSKRGLLSALKERHERLTHLSEEEREAMQNEADLDSISHKLDLLEQQRGAGGMYRWFPRAYDLSSEQQRNFFLSDFERLELAAMASRSGQLPSAAASGSVGAGDFVDLLPPLQPKIDGERNVWIVKPSEGARGGGIRVFNNATALLDYAQSRDFDMVVQKYIERPLLYDGYKFDIRQFVLVTSLAPLTVFIHDLCYLRLASKLYALDTLDDNFQHLTNTQIQKHAEGEGDQGALNQRSLAQFRKHLQSTVARLGARRQRVLARTAEEEETDRKMRAARHCDDPVYCSREDVLAPDTWQLHIKPAIEDIVRSTMRAWPERDTYHRGNSFELLGFDLMLDRAYRPYLIEFNVDPGIHNSGPVVDEHHKQVIDDTLEVLLDFQHLWKDTKKFEEKSGGAKENKSAEESDSSEEQALKTRSLLVNRLKIGGWKLIDIFDDE